MKSFSNFLQEAQGNPTGTGLQTPGEKAKMMGLESDGHGGYRDPKTGNLVARTVNNELVFYSPGPTGGVVSDGSGGAYVAQAQPTWSDPVTGYAMTPPAKPETPEEIAAAPRATPATPPAGFHAYMKQRRDQAYQDNETIMNDDMGGMEQE